MTADHGKILDFLLHLTGLWFSIFLLYHLVFLWKGPMRIREDNKVVLILEIIGLLITSTLYIVTARVLFKAQVHKEETP